MTRRSRAREVALQLLFQRDHNPSVDRATIERFARARLREPSLEPFCLGLYDGVVAQRLVEERQNIRAMEPVVRFQDVEELEIAVDVPETVMVADIRTADILQMVAEISGAPRVQFPVTIREIAQEADPTTQTFRVRAAMKAPESIQILPGMTATSLVPDIARGNGISFAELCERILDGAGLKA